MKVAKCNFNDLIQQFIENSKDGYGIFCPDDKLLFANYAFLDIFCVANQSPEFWSFEELVRHAYVQRRGINIETDSLDDWLKYVHKVRRQRPFRIFEVDLVDGRWMLFSEQLLPSGELLVQTKDLTRQKVTESSLEKSVNKLNKLALTDELTQLANRRAFVTSVETELARCQRNNNLVTMMVIDLDFFKKINDTFGHLGGDKVLVHAAKLLKMATRQYDIVGRIGGEEFAVFMSMSDPDSAERIATRIRSIFAQTPFDVDGVTSTVTASIGVATMSCDTSFEALYDKSDNALYKAKKSGRNKVIFSDNDYVSES